MPCLYSRGNSILDLWHPVLLVDDGEHLINLFAYRNQVCTPKFNGFANEWIDKPGIEEAVAEKLSDITIRYKLEDCVIYHLISFTVLHTFLLKSNRCTKPLLKRVSCTLKQVRLMLYTREFWVKKLPQLISGGVYDDEGQTQYFHQERYNLVIDLIKERKHCIVAFIGNTKRCTYRTS